MRYEHINIATFVYYDSFKIYGNLHKMKLCNIINESWMFDFVSQYKFVSNILNTIQVIVMITDILFSNINSGIQIWSDIVDECDEIINSKLSDSTIDDINQFTIFVSEFPIT